ncbi:hypothetical protein [uncultured Legionella sp.]|uniref:hypothetical protein n=1 Tax=uncultured Legionella sp. TaxID=210934 RepID=UPI00261801D9|nr:hypothetical protein [uncultured Legionella sp.]
MPHKNGGKKQLIIIDHLSLVVDKLMSRVADESEAGQAALVKIIESARNRYNKPIESWITGWFYQYSRVRGHEIDLAIQSIEKFPDAYTRLQEFKILIDSGKWHHGSFNYYFIDELIHSLPGYEPLTDEIRHGVIVRVSELIKENISSFMQLYKANRKLIESKEQELKQTQQSNQRIVDNVLIANNLDMAKKSALISPNTIQFSLTKHNNLWNLHWVDVLGKAYAITPGEELITLLDSQKSADLNSFKAITQRHLKQECVKARDLFLDRVQVLVNPRDHKTQKELNNKDLARQNHLNVFVLRGQNGRYSLSWINALGNAKTILLDGYPKLSSWLSGQASLTEEHFYKLRSYLLYVNTAKAIGREDFKVQLKMCLEKRMHPGSEAQPDTEISEQVEVRPNKLDMSLFADLARCLDPSRKEKQTEKSEGVKDEAEILSDSPSTLIAPGRLNLDLFSSVAKSLGHKSKESSVKERAVQEVAEHTGPAPSC